MRAYCGNSILIIFGDILLLCGTGRLSLDLLLDFLLDFLNGASDTLLLRLLPEEDTGDLNDSDESEEEVYGGEAAQVSGCIKGRYGDVVQVVLGLDDQAPTGPDETGAGQGEVLGERELLGRTSEIGNTSEDKSPLRWVSDERNNIG